MLRVTSSAASCWTKWPEPGTVISVSTSSSQSQVSLSAPGRRAVSASPWNIRTGHEDYVPHINCPEQEGQEIGLFPECPSTPADCGAESLLAGPLLVVFLRLPSGWPLSSGAPQHQNAHVRHPSDHNQRGQVDIHRGRRESLIGHHDAAAAREHPRQSYGVAGPAWKVVAQDCS